MSAEYCLKQFMFDFITIPELARLLSKPETRRRMMRHYFRKYGENAEAVGDIHAQVIAALGEYIGLRRPELANAMERAPHSLLAAVFFLVSEKGIERPTPDQIEMAEANQAPRGPWDFLGPFSN